MGDKYGCLTDCYRSDGMTEYACRRMDAENHKIREAKAYREASGRAERLREELMSQICPGQRELARGLEYETSVRENIIGAGLFFAGLRSQKGYSPGQAMTLDTRHLLPRPSPQTKDRHSP
jgi:hypothetical protein